MIGSRDDGLLLKIGVWSVAAVFLLETSSNALFGFRYAGGFANLPAAVIMAVASVAVAVFGALMAEKCGHLSWNNPAKWKLGTLAMLCVAFSFVAGLRLVGVTMADGALKRERAATKGAVAGDKLDAKRAARKALGVQPDPKQIEASIAKELAVFIGKADKTVGAATKNCAEPNWAPAVCKRVGDLRVRLADAEQARALDGEIEQAAASVDGAPVVAGGDPDMQRVASLLPGWTPQDVKDWLPVAIVAIMTLIANFGWSLVGSSSAPPRADAPPMYLPRRADGWGDEPDGWAPPSPHGGGDFGGPRRHAPRETAGGESMFGVQPSAGGNGGYAAAAPANLTGSPISIVFGAGSVPSTNAAPGVTAPAYQPPVAGDARSQGVSQPVLVRQPRHDIASLPADGPPVDRSGMVAGIDGEQQQPADVVMAFRAACLVEAPGSMVPADAVYRRYAAWAGPRAVTQAAFEALATAVGIGVVRVAGHAHVRDVMLRASAPLAAAG